MKALVAGAGAVGSWVGGALAAAGADVTLVARGAHGAAMAEAGLTLRGIGGRWAVHTRPCVVSRVADAAPAAPFDVALVAVKSYDTASVAAELAEAGVTRCVVSLQNGVGNEAVLAGRLPGCAVAPATLTTGVTIPKPGTVEGSRKGGVGVAPAAPPAGTPAVPPPDASAAPHAAILAELVARLLDAGIDARHFPDGAALKWSKLLLNMLGNATCAILGWPPDRAFNDPRVFAIEHAAWREALAVMRAHGIPAIALPGYPVATYARFGGALPTRWLYMLAHRSLARARGGRLPGVAADLVAGRPRSEVEVLNGAVALAGARARIATPVNQVLRDLVVELAAGHLPRHTFADQPTVLCAAVDAGRAPAVSRQ